MFGWVLNTKYLYQLDKGKTRVQNKSIKDNFIRI